MRQDALDKANEDPRGTAARILDAAEEVFAERGYGATSTREIARCARVPFGALHYHWGSKKDLWEAVFHRLGERTRATIMRNLVPGRTPGETIDNFTDAFLELLIAYPRTTRLAFRMSLERPELHLPSVRQMIRELGELGKDVFRSMVMDSEIDLAAAIHVISNAFMGAVADVDGQEALLGGNITSSRQARERLRAELKRVGRAVFRVAE